MALTPEDVVNKQFQQTKFREGYDQDEVDDFLDEVVVELRRLIQENENLKEQVSKAEAGSSTPSSSEPTTSEFVAEKPAAAAPAPAWSSEPGCSSTTDSRTRLP